MAAQFETLEHKLLRLPEESRERLANALLDSLPGFAAHEFSQQQLSEFGGRSAEIERIRRISSGMTRCWPKSNVLFDKHDGEVSSLGVARVHQGNPMVRGA